MAPFDGHRLNDCSERLYSTMTADPARLIAVTPGGVNSGHQGRLSRRTRPRRVSCRGVFGRGKRTDRVLPGAGKSLGPQQPWSHPGAALYQHEARVTGRCHGPKMLDVQSVGFPRGLNAVTPRPHSEPQKTEEIPGRGIIAWRPPRSSPRRRQRHK